jgi:hypothetical protein
LSAFCWPGLVSCSGWEWILKLLIHSDIWQDSVARRLPAQQDKDKYPSLMRNLNPRTLRSSGQGHALGRAGTLIGFLISMFLYSPRHFLLISPQSVFAWCETKFNTRTEQYKQWVQLDVSCAVGRASICLNSWDFSWLAGDVIGRADVLLINRTRNGFDALYRKLKDIRTRAANFETDVCKAVVCHHECVRQRGPPTSRFRLHKCTPVHM